MAPKPNFTTVWLQLLISVTAQLQVLKTVFMMLKPVTEPLLFSPKGFRTKTHSNFSHGVDLEPAQPQTVETLSALPTDGGAYVEVTELWKETEKKK